MNILNTEAKRRGYQNWLNKVDSWANSHGINRKQALSILVLDSSKNGLEENTLMDLMGYINFSDFSEEALNSVLNEDEVLIKDCLVKVSDDLYRIKMNDGSWNEIDKKNLIISELVPRKYIR